MSDTSKSNGTEKMKAKKYEKELRKLQGELCKLQEWVKFKGLRVIIIFEGRDAAGKGGTIKAITARAIRSREVADVPPALHTALSGRGGSGDF